MSTPILSLDASPVGALSIWKQPESGRKYVLGADCAGGKSGSDYAACVVVDAEDCAVVARWRERENAEPWGRKCASLAWHFNEAVLAFETYPSAHGVSACHAAMALAYPNIYRHIKNATFPRKATEDLGWRTDSITKPQMLDRITRALADDCDIPDEQLLLELRDQSRGDKPGELVSSGHDDMVIAYSIALCVRDYCWQRGELRIEPKKPTTFEEMYEAQEERRMKAEERRFARRRGVRAG